MKIFHLLILSTVNADDHNVVPNLPVLVIAFGRLLECFPSPRFLSQLDICLRQVVPSFKILKNSITIKIQTDVIKTYFSVQGAKFSVHFGTVAPILFLQIHESQLAHDHWLK